MNNYNYLISCDPSMKNSGFVLWEKESHSFGWQGIINEIKSFDIWMPIKIISLPIKNFDWNTGNKIYRSFDLSVTYGIDIDKLIIEQGFSDPKRLRGALQLERVRGFIEGTLGLCGERVHIQTWRKFNLEYFCKDEDGCKPIKKWDKNLSIELANKLIKEQNWNIKISNYDEAEALLIGWYWINNNGGK